MSIFNGFGVFKAVLTIGKSITPCTGIELDVSPVPVFTEASMDPRNVEIKSPRPSYFMLTCLGIPRHDDKKYVNMSTLL